MFGCDSGIAVSATKSATGIGAAGGLGAVFEILAPKNQVAPPMLILNVPDPADGGINFLVNRGRQMTMDYAFANCFGGVSASVVSRRRFQSGQSSVGPVSDIQSEALAILNVADQPLTVPAVSPATNQRWASMKINTTGTEATTAKAMKYDHDIPIESKTWLTSAT